MPPRGWVNRDQAATVPNVSCSGSPGGDRGRGPRLLRGTSTTTQAGAQEAEPTLTFFLRRRWTRAASCTVLSVSAWWAGASDTWAIMVVRQLAVASVSRSNAVSLCSLGVGGRGSEAEGLGRVLGDCWVWGLQ